MRQCNKCGSVAIKYVKHGYYRCMREDCNNEGKSFSQLYDYIRLGSTTMQELNTGCYWVRSAKSGK